MCYVPTGKPRATRRCIAINEARPHAAALTKQPSFRESDLERKTPSTPIADRMGQQIGIKARLIL
jgi:hypothetical protein